MIWRAKSGRQRPLTTAQLRKLKVVFFLYQNISPSCPSKMFYHAIDSETFSCIYWDGKKWYETIWLKADFNGMLQSANVVVRVLFCPAQTDANATLCQSTGWKNVMTSTYRPARHPAFCHVLSVSGGATVRDFSPQWKRPRMGCRAHAVLRCQPGKSPSPLVG